MTELAGQGGTVPLFATPFTALNTGADRDFNARLASKCESLRSAPTLPNDPSRDPLHRRVSTIVAVVVWLGFTVVPVAVFFGVIR